jgi:hypothetical protein
MAKRARGATGRPGRRRSNQRPGARLAPTPSVRPATSVPSEASGDDAPEPTVDRSIRSPRPRTRSTSTSFSESAAQEYAYVTADVRRIGVVAGGLFATLAILFLLIDVLRIIHL